MATYVKKGPFQNGVAAPPLNAAFFDGIETALAGIPTSTPTTYLTGTGIDPTGVTDSTAGINTFFNNLTDGTTVVIPDGAILNLAGTLSIGKRIRLTGTGELRWTTGVQNSIAFYIGADDTVLDGIRCVNATGTAAQTGNKQYGIQINAMRVKVINCLVKGFQQAISVSPFGEFHDFIIANNNVIDVPGSGDGPTNTTSNQGEDRGDGIVSWGAAGVIANNRVVAAAGADARIGIHCEGLANLETNGYQHSSALTTITGNTITGQFRRGIVSESVTACQIVGNSIADPTWWGVALINSYYCVVANNTINWTRTSSDNQGSAWSPRRSAVMVYGTGAGNVISSNTVWTAAGANLTYGVSAQTANTGNLDNLLIDGNHLVDSSQAMTIGVYLDGANNTLRYPRVINNTIGGYTSRGILFFDCDDIDASNNQLIANTNFNTQGIRAEGSASSARINANTIGSSSSSTAIACYGRNVSTFVSNNVINQASVGIDLYGCAAATVNSNLFAYTTTKTTNLPAGAITVGNN